ncbi:MAG: hypothetical protein U1E26_05720 [Coriobacteriia bacterium]|nr:hypothetical protein [Coriobacteriia bacterium]
MIRINLLPPEIIERRKYERFYPYVFIAAAVLVGLVLVVWGYLQFVASARSSELQSIEQTAADLRKQADSLAVFELKEQDVAARQEAATVALAGRVDIGRIAEEVSQVLPEEVWLTQVRLTAPPNGVPGAPAEETCQLLGFTPGSEGTSVKGGFKSVAATLVRAASLTDSLYNVWLAEAVEEAFADYQGIATDFEEVPGVRFDISASTVVPGVAPGTVQATP